MAVLQDTESLVAAKRLTWLDGLLALLCGGMSLALYVRTLVPFVLVGDSAEFQVLAYQVGIAHMPGYPVYILLAKLCTLLPIRTIAYRANLFSAVMAAITVAGVYLATTTLTRRRLAGVFASLALAVSYTFWSQSIIAEVYTSGSACVALIWLGLLAWYRTGKHWPLFLAGLCGGLSLGMHTTVALFAPAVLLFLWLNRRRWDAPWRPAMTGAVLGTLLYLAAYAAVDLNAAPANMFNAAYESARSDWNVSQADLANPVKRFLFLATATQWRSAMFTGWSGVPGRMFMYVRGLRNEFTGLTIVLAVVGLGLLFWRESSLGWLFLTAFLAHWLFTFTYQVGDIYVFYISGYVLMSMLAGYAAATIADWIQKLRVPGASYLSAAALLVLLAFGIWPVLAPHWRNVRAGSIPFLGTEGYLVDNQTQNTYRVAEGVVTQLPPNAIVFIEWERLYAYYYAAQVAHQRFDLRFIEAAPRADQQGLPDSAIPFINDHLATHPLFFAQPWDEVQRAGYHFQARTIQFTRLYQVEKDQP